MRPVAATARTGRDRRCRTGTLDSSSDRALPERWQTLARDALLVVGGAFLLRPDLAEHWEYTVWLDVGFDTVLERARRRDVAWVGSEEAVVRRYRERWIPAHQLYERSVDPVPRVHIVVDNTDPERPVVTRHAPGAFVTTRSNAERGRTSRK